VTTGNQAANQFERCGALIDSGADSEVLEELLEIVTAVR
jgi:hypothetical protein